MQTVAVLAWFLVMLTSHTVLSRNSRLFNNYVEDFIEKTSSDDQKTVGFERKSKALFEQPLTFSWSDCGSSSSVVHVTSVTLEPNPLDLPGSPQLGFTATVSKNLSSVISMDLKILVKVLFVWVPVPCVDNIGSCSYRNVCPGSTDSVCPPSFAKYGIPCTCPIAQGSYKLPPTSIKLDLSVPHGDYKVNARLHDNGTEIACLNLDVSISGSSKQGVFGKPKSNLLETRDDRSSGKVNGLS